MGVEVDKRKKLGILRCDCSCGCTNTIRVTPERYSPAAPELSCCEEAKKHGWTYTIGFWSMLMGHDVMCPECNSRIEEGHVVVMGSRR